MSRASEHKIQIARTARYYTLGEPAARTCWLVCHGYAQLAGRFIRSFESVAGSEHFIVAPEGLHRFYLDPADRPAAQRRVGATWMTREDRETDIADYIAYLDAVYGATCRHAQFVNVLGFSQGVATVARWAAATEQRIDRLVLWGSYLPPDLDWRVAAERLSRFPVQFVIGDQDEFADARKQAELEAHARQAGLSLLVTVFNGGHVMDAVTLQRISEV